VLRFGSADESHSLFMKGYKKKEENKMAKADVAAVMKKIEENDIYFIKLWFTDILGFLKSFSVPKGEIEKAMTEGIGFDGSSIEGFVRIDESDMVAIPDPSTFAILPWRPKEKAVARMFCDIVTPDGKPFEGDPRYVLKKNLAKAKAKGLT
jgi:glutamine synthetase